MKKLGLQAHASLVRREWRKTILWMTTADRLLAHAVSKLFISSSSFGTISHPEFDDLNYPEDTLYISKEGVFLRQSHRPRYISSALLPSLAWPR